ncbi:MULTISPECIES: hypothetical protein [unclassified Halomonas]|uniref:hypothetical protein n=1 Tax=unclassified Halomonas TaxID=2609666 RepID=UPI0007D9A691|nr:MULTISPECIES: hypothetical protein [unclassified Halomonas]MBT2788369.1 hypothetical protein [Halomonas sp. ISL-106]MBT2797960.1 hypothetical protein [Halomonas sp. ISL-104]OAL60533.1 hypothetical protein A6R74_17540 [Halomonas sp. ALS9]
MKYLMSVLVLIILLTGCDFKKEADQKFGDQHFKTAISLIELHKTRFGEYPSNLSELMFIGDWDQIALQSVQYSKVEDGYALTLRRGWVGKPELHYPADFWQGLGIKGADNLIQPDTKASAD